MVKFDNFLQPVLALDPSLNCTGYSVFNNGELKEYGEIRLKNKNILAEKLYLIENYLMEIIAKNNIKVAVMEKYMLLFNNRNTSASTAKTLPMVRGVMEKLFFQMHVEYVEISANTVKKITTGNHKAKKDEVCDKINKYFNINLSKTKDLDISDSIAVGFSFFNLYDIKNNINNINDINEVIDFFKDYNGLKTKTQKNLRSIGVNIEKWKSLM